MKKTVRTLVCINYCRGAGKWGLFYQVHTKQISCNNNWERANKSKMPQSNGMYKSVPGTKLYQTYKLADKYRAQLTQDGWFALREVEV